MRRFVSVLLVALALTGCTTTTRYRVPLAQNPMRTEALACERTCQEHEEQREYLSCLETCPGVTIVPGTCSGPENRGPEAICREDSRLSDGGKVMIGVGIGATLLAGLVYVAAAAVADKVEDSEPIDLGGGCWFADCND